ncbi:TagF domain-containing protein [Cupriavidus nantongensis]
MITAPSMFGKLPGQRDFVRHRAPLDQVQAWRSCFDGGDDALPVRAASHAANAPARQWLHLTPPSLSGPCRLRPGEPCQFVLRPGGLQFPGGRGYLVGVIAASHDQVGRRYPLVVWQCASAGWAGHVLAPPAQWLTELAQLVRDHTHEADRTGLPAAIDALWARHQPRWGDRLRLSLGRLAEAGARASGRRAPSAMCESFLPDLLRHGSLGSVWQSTGRGPFEIDGLASIRRIVAGL